MKIHGRYVAEIQDKIAKRDPERIKRGIVREITYRITIRVQEDSLNKFLNEYREEYLEECRIVLRPKTPMEIPAVLNEEILRVFPEGIPEENYEGSRREFQEVNQEKF